MASWQKSACICCAQNCGLELEIEGNRIVKVRADKDNPRSQGYVCRKGLKIAHYQHNSSRLIHPLKRTSNGFQRISWDDGLDEIATTLRRIVDTGGPRSVAYMGGGGQGCHFEAAFGVRLLRGLGSRYHYSALAQELTGMFWAHGRMFGRQYLAPIPDEHQTDMLISVGWNGWMSHQMPQARRHLKRISDDPEKLLVVIDPRKSETAQKADIHLALRPGTDALLFKAMISIILNERWQDADYISRHVSGLAQISPWFKDFDAKAAIKVCELDYAQVRELCRLCGTRKWSLHTDLGILMNRHSTVVSYLAAVLMTICGRVGVQGGNLFPGYLMPLGAHSDERDKRTWRTAETDFFEIMGTFPPNVMPEEILSGREDRLRAVIVSGANPLRSYADTSAYEEAFRKLDLSVTIDVVMSETAALSQYVLPARSAYEKWDGTFFAWTHPEVFFQMRRPLLAPEGEPREESEIFTGLAERLGLIPPYPESLTQAALGDRLQFGLQLMQYAASEPRAAATLPFILARTLATALGSPNLAALWGLLQTAPKSFREMAVNAGFNPGLTIGEEIFQAILDHPEGLWIGKSDPEKNLESVRTEDGKINVFVPELADWIDEIDAPREKQALSLSAEYPLVLTAGRHFDHNANTIMRDPAWNDHKEACTLLIHPSDAAAAGIKDGQRVSVTTEAGRVEIPTEVTDTCSAGHVVIPHGFGLEYEGKTHGANVNRLAKNTNRDRLAATPLHRFIPCRVEPCG